MILECLEEDPENANYGVRRIYTWLFLNKDYMGSYYKVSRILKENNLIIKKAKRSSYKTKSLIDRHAGVPDLVERQFRADRPNEKFFMDITEETCKDGKFFIAAVLDAFDGSVRNYSIGKDMTAPLVTSALEGACIKENVNGAIIHTDHGKVFNSKIFIDVVNKYNLKRSMGKTYCCFDNSRMESFHATIKKEKLFQIDLKELTFEQIRSIVFQYVCYYNHRRIALFNFGYPPLVMRDLYYSGMLSEVYKTKAKLPKAVTRGL